MGFCSRTFGAGPENICDSNILNEEMKGGENSIKKERGRQ